MFPLRLLLSAALIAVAIGASALSAGVDLPNLTFPENDDVISTQSCKTGAQTGVLVCGTGD